MRTASLFFATSSRSMALARSSQLASILAEHRMRSGQGGALIFPKPGTTEMLTPNGGTLKRLVDEA